MQYLSRYPEKDPSQPFRQETTFARLLLSIAPLFGNGRYVVSGRRIFRDRAQACDPCVGHAFRRVTDDGVQGALVAQVLRAKVAEEDDLSWVHEGLHRSSGADRGSGRACRWIRRGATRTARDWDLGFRCRSTETAAKRRGGDIAGRSLGRARRA